MMYSPVYAGAGRDMRACYLFCPCRLLFTVTPLTATECTQNGLTAHFGAATLGFLVTFAHKKHLAGYYL